MFALCAKNNFFRMSDIVVHPVRLSFLGRVTEELVPFNTHKRDIKILIIMFISVTYGAVKSSYSTMPLVTSAVL